MSGSLSTRGVAIAEKYLSRVCVRPDHRPINIRLLAVCIDGSTSQAQQHRDLATALALDAIRIAREPYADDLAREVANHIHGYSLPAHLENALDVEAGE